jgi:hypothetical protein
MNAKLVGIGILLGSALVWAVTSVTEPEQSSDDQVDRHADVETAPVPVKVAVLQSRLTQLELQHTQAMARLSMLEGRLSTMPQGPVFEESDTAPAVPMVGPSQAENLLVNRLPGAPPQQAQWFAEAGITEEEFSDMERQAAQINRDGFEQDWLQRRQNYLDSPPGSGSQDQLRNSLGDDAYDRYLYASGNGNRVRIGGVLPDSAAAVAGLAPGDVVLSYADERVFNFNDLRRLSYQGEVGEPVVMEVRRSDDSVSQLVMPRGPLGVSGLGRWREVPGG